MATRRFATLAIWLLVALGQSPLLSRAAGRLTPAPYLRTLWTTSRVVGSPDPPPPYKLERVYPQIKFDQPLYLIAEPTSDRIIVGERGGKIHTFDSRSGEGTANLAGDIKREVYAIGFHPAYRENGLIYVLSNDAVQGGATNRLTRHHVVHDPLPRLDPASETTILEWSSNGHNGGDVAFGPDGYLYVSAGDGTSGSDPLETGQNLSDLLGVVARIDVDHPSESRPYSIPADNPYLGVESARGEIWAYGFRNPWRFSFDPRDGRLWLGDIGQDQWEMIYLVERGGNYGWSAREGGHPFVASRETTFGKAVTPILEHPHSEARSIVGGLVYRGAKFPELRDAYIYGDHETGKVWGAWHNVATIEKRLELADSRLKPLSFAVDGAGEILIADFIGGEVYRLATAPKGEPDAAPVPDFPRKLSQTGLFESVSEGKPSAGLIPYEVNSPLWSDGAEKERYLAIPSAATIEYKPDGAWGAPEGTVLVKTFSLPLAAPAGRSSPDRRLTRVETRLLTLQAGEWQGYSYAWNDEQTDAILVEAAGRDREWIVVDPTEADGKRKQTWRFPSRAECMMCHSRAAGYVLGLNTWQMNRRVSFQGRMENQLAALDARGVFSESLESTPGHRSRLPDPRDASESLEARARSYLHANCFHCHAVDGGGNSKLVLGYATPPAERYLIDARPQHDVLGLKDARVVAPGDPDRSTLLRRLTTVGPGRMPRVASSVVDREGAQLIRDWILSLSQDAQLEP